MTPPTPDAMSELLTRVHDLEALLGQHNNTLASTFRLSPANCNLLGLLLALDYVTPEVIVQRLQIASDVKVALHRLRRRLTEFTEFAIPIRSRRNVGYWLDAATKDNINRRLT